jgi:hypothetical protein
MQRCRRPLPCTDRAREDVLASLDGIGLQVLDRMLRLDEERRAEAGSDEEEEEMVRPRQRSLHPVECSSSPGGELHATTPPPLFPFSDTHPRR